MHPIHKSTLKIVLGFTLIVALAYFNRQKIERHNLELARNNPVLLPKK